MIKGMKFIEPDESSSFFHKCRYKKMQLWVLVTKHDAQLFTEDIVYTIVFSFCIRSALSSGLGIYLQSV